ncbi:hypothetical protein I4U23_005706 [Adineta vaga]|nr:hypothetical protein I4U23_005706 [Adineta vaga]
MHFDVDYVGIRDLASFDGDNMTDVVFDASLIADAHFNYKPYGDNDVFWRYMCTTNHECTSNYLMKYALYYLQLSKQRVWVWVWLWMPLQVTGLINNFWNPNFRIQVQIDYMYLIHLLTYRNEM